MHSDLVRAFDTGLRTGILPLGVSAKVPDETARRFDVYRNTVAYTLSEALARRFPVIQRLVGPEFFAALAQAYLQDNRPRSPVLLEWGDSFAGYLSEFPPLANYPYMADVARIEFARGQAFHAADCPPANAADIASLDPDTMGLALHPALRVLHLDHPAVSIWAANQPGQATPQVSAQGPQIALIFRDRDFNVPVAAITRGDATMITALQAGAALTDSALAAQAIDPDHDPHALIRQLFLAGTICARKEMTP